MSNQPDIPTISFSAASTDVQWLSAYPQIIDVVPIRTGYTPYGYVVKITGSLFGDVDKLYISADDFSIFPTLSNSVVYVQNFTTSALANSGYSTTTLKQLTANFVSFSAVEITAYTKHYQGNGEKKLLKYITFGMPRLSTTTTKLYIRPINKAGYSLNLTTNIVSAN